MLPVMKRQLWVLTMVLLAACESGEVRDTLGLDREAPDEFKVVSRPPLSVPPEFDLRPPEPGAPPRASASSEKQAKKLILQDSDLSAGSSFGSSYDLDGYTPESETAVDPVVSGDLASSAESTFMSNLGVEKADPEIRTKLYREEKAKPTPKQEEDISPLEKWLGAEPGDPVVDAKAEAKRIRKNKDEGKPVTEGEVKTLDKKKGSVLDRLF